MCETILKWFWADKIGKGYVNWAYANQNSKEVSNMTINAFIDKGGAFIINYHVIKIQ